MNAPSREYMWTAAGQRAGSCVPLEPKSTPLLSDPGEIVGDDRSVPAVSATDE